MSHSFYIAAQAPLDIQTVLRGTALPSIVVPDEFASTTYWPEGTHYLYVDEHSVRPVEVTLEDGRLQVRIFICSSPVDYRLALNLVRAAAEVLEAPIEPENEDAPLAPADFAERYGDDWIRRHCLTGLKSFVQMYKSASDRLTLAGARAELEAGPRFMEPLLAAPAVFPQEFFERFRRLNYLDRDHSVFNAALMDVKNNEGQRVTLATYGEGVPTVISAKADVVCLANEGASLHVRFEEFARLLGKRAVWLSEDVLLAPESLGAEWQELVRQAMSAHMPDLFEDAKAEAQAPVTDRAFAPATRNSFSEEEWGLLQLSPVYVFLLVAAADGKISKKEIAGFHAKLADFGLKHSGLIQEVVLSLIPRLAEAVEAAGEMADKLVEVLAACTGLLGSTLSPEDGETFKRGLYELGVAVAESSGGFFGFGKRIGKREKEALAALAELLALKVAE